MQLITDLHIHSKYSRACSKDLTLENLAMWARKKGIGLMGTGDFTHPAWFKDVSQKLKETAHKGLYTLAAPIHAESASWRNAETRREPLFMLTAEVSSIYKQGDKVRRIHNLLFAPSIESVEKLIAALESRGVNLKADGRPIMGVQCPDLVKICKDVDERMEVVPAHAWTPHFGVFGSLSGFNTLEEAFGDQAQHIFAIETGLSSDPGMNWRVPMLDTLSLISNSDAHSLRKLGREANVLNISDGDLAYDTIIFAIKNKDPKVFTKTIEFFPEEGKYHLDGHRDCRFSCEPEETRRLDGICPVCGKKLLRGVMGRVAELAHDAGQSGGPGRVPYVSSIPLEEVIAETLGVGPGSKKVLEMYERMVKEFPEFSILLDCSRAEIARISSPEIAESIMRVREGRLAIEAGYDGIFGTVHIYQERERGTGKPAQQALF